METSEHQDSNSHTGWFDDSDQDSGAELEPGKSNRAQMYEATEESSQNIEEKKRESPFEQKSLTDNGRRPNDFNQQKSDYDTDIDNHMIEQPDNTTSLNEELSIIHKEIHQKLSKTSIGNIIISAIILISNLSKRQRRAQRQIINDLIGSMTEEVKAYLAVATEDAGSSAHNPEIEHGLAQTRLFLLNYYLENGPSESYSGESIELKVQELLQSIDQMRKQTEIKESEGDESESAEVFEILFDFHATWVSQLMLYIDGESLTLSPAYDGQVFVDDLLAFALLRPLFDSPLERTIEIVKDFYKQITIENFN